MPNRTAAPIRDQVDTRSPSRDSTTGLFCTVFRGRREILALRQQIWSLRVGAGLQEDPTTDPDWFVNTAISQSYIPWIVILADQQGPVAAMLLAERSILGLPSGFLKAEGMDRCFLICCSHLRYLYLPILLNGLFSKRPALIVQLAQLAASETAYAAPADPRALKMAWKQLLYHHRLKLMDTKEKTLALYGAHTRRNLRYNLRRARAEGYLFFADLNNDQRLEAVRNLRPHATHRVTTESAKLREAALQSTPSSFAMGVQDANGRWVSYLTGWREGEQTTVYWQMNRAVEKSLSMNIAIRSFLMDEEIARGATEIIFVGGASGFFRHCCEVEPSVYLILRRRGLRGWALSSLLKGITDPSHPMGIDRSY